MAAGSAAKAQRCPRRTQPPVAPSGVMRYRFTPELFEQLGELGLFRDQRVELIGGEIVQMAPVRPEHGSTVDQTMLSVGQRLSQKNYYLRIQNPLRMGDSEPFPDIAIVPGKPRDYRHTIPPPPCWSSKSPTPR